MHKTPSEAVSTAKALKVKLINIKSVDVVVCPPFTDLLGVREILKESAVKLGGQNIHWADQGAFTGEVSAHMLKDAGCEFVILGHSERRHIFGEKDDEINRKVQKALEVGLKPIFCVGETLEQRKSGLTKQVVGEQIRGGLAGVDLADSAAVVVAYEPVWAIGTGENATPAQAEEVHGFIRELLAELYGESLASGLRIQYGGSVKPANARELLQQENVDGALVGGASLEADSFAGIVKAAEVVLN